ncbi:alpha-N-acetylgalactosaminidase-like [Neocloeon triangulifer]|uniref:alpha-N-acetylgalactosaminidase-like n=1 Tax=Neocloeon triangulifer TaxID=2078957 RepID=UPI00286F09DE|nr:alpha-N-acetylgalactosaminidase-like [Neocloeon triangulifer]
MQQIAFAAFVALSIAGVVSGLDNGLSLTPPMGWLAWERFRCITNCTLYPDDCISDKLFRTMADLLVSQGYAAVGYDYINIDDCWLSKERDANGRLQADPERFPYGIKDLAAYVHSKGLKFGIYEDFGNFTCAGYPGVIDNLKLDAETFASWDVDYVKLDGCYAELVDMETGYPEFGFHMNQTGRPMVYSCSWPAYQTEKGIDPNYTVLAQHCNLWRNYDDIQDSYASLRHILDYFGQKQDDMGPFAGPGHWNDPDMLLIGNYGLSLDQSKLQMALWAILAAPLFMSTDLRTIRPEHKEILQNTRIIAIDQDPLGIQGRIVYNVSKIEIWTRKITPVEGDQYSFAIAVASRRDDGYPYRIQVPLKDIGLTNPAGYMVQDLYGDETETLLVPESLIDVRVNPSGTVFWRANIVVSTPSVTKIK